MTDRPARILLADDLPLFRQAIAQLIDTQADLEVVGQAPNGLLAVEAAIELRPGGCASNCPTCASSC